MLSTPRPYRLHWDREIGWILDVDMLLSDHAIQKVLDWALPKQIERFHGLAPGDRKDDLKAAIKVLEQARTRPDLIKQNLINPRRGDGKGELTIIDADRRH